MESKWLDMKSIKLYMASVFLGLYLVISLNDRASLCTCMLHDCTCLRCRQCRIVRPALVSL